jgi:TonB-linked SusC/RagA family outer membrane protein
LFCCQARAQAIGQGNITLSVKDVPVEQVFKELKKQSGYGFVYPSEVLSRIDRVTLSVKKVTLEEVLNQVFKGQPYTYSIIDKVVIIKFREVAANQPAKQATIGGNPIDVAGKVTNEKGEPLPGVTVTVKGTDKITSTDAGGAFLISSVDREATLVFSSINMEPFELKVSGKSELAIRMRAKVRELDDVTVMVNTGYEKVPKERATGSFEFVTKKELDRRVGPDILSRLEGVSNSIFFDKRNLSASPNTLSLNNIVIRGITTLTTSPENIKQPLIVVNNFPYEGNISNINPNDVESITILKDAAASSIYGARAANGVIVITTKQGQLNQSAKISFNTNLQVTERPDLFHNPRMTSSEFMEVETFLFNKGFYNGDLNNKRFPALSPLVEMLARRRAGLISSNDSSIFTNKLKTFDVRNDFEKYIYQKGVSQQYYLNINGGSNKYSYSLGAGFDKSTYSKVGDKSHRITLVSENTYTPIEKLLLNLSIRYTNSQFENNSLGEINSSSSYGYRNFTKNLYPYAHFTDEQGRPTTMAQDYRQGYIDTAGAGNLLNWNYSVLDELNNKDNKSKEQDIVINSGIQFKLTKYLSLQGSYQYQNSNGENLRLYNEQTYYARNLINLYTNLNATNPQLRNPVPIGGILDHINSKKTSHYGRAQITFAKSWNSKHQLNGLAGAEIRETITTINGARVYGYNADRLSSTSVDYVNQYPLQANRGNQTVPVGPGSYNKLTDHFVSLFANAAYIYNRRYTISGSIRRDAANIFGVDINNLWKPFWSIGGSWNISDESFFNVSTIPYLKARITYGNQGNVNNSLSPYTILSFSPASVSPYNIPFATINTPANPGLSWEKVSQLNIGLDFHILNNRITGSFDFYRKQSGNLILSSNIDQTTGISNIQRNSASMRGNGFELSLVTINLKSPFLWNSEISISHISNKVTRTEIDYKNLTAQGAVIISGSGINITARPGISPYAIFSYPFAGLDPLTGDPKGYLGKETSVDYQGIANQKYDTSNLIYHGSAIPTYFGNFNNSFSYKGIDLLISITYRFGYYFRKKTISYYDLYQTGDQHPDFSKRWKKAGDEEHTTVPSMIYPLQDQRRDDFYAYSSVNVLKGDNIRLQNIRIAYDLSNLIARRSLPSIKLYTTVENLGIIWRANKEDLDPDYDTGNTAYPVPRRYAIGLKLDL